MDIQQFILALDELHSKYNQMKEAQHLGQIVSFQQSPIKDQNWLNAVDSFIASIWDSYPSLRYYIENITMVKMGRWIFKR